MKAFSTLGFIFVLLGVSLSVAAQKNGRTIWAEVSESDLQARNLVRTLNPEAYKTFRLDRDGVQRVLSDAPLEHSEAARSGGTILTIPNPKGELVRFGIVETALLSPSVAAEYPTWKTYQGYGIDDPTATARFDFTESGFHGYVWGSDGTFSIDPYSVSDQDNYLVFYKNDTKKTRFECDVDGQLTADKLFKNSMDTSYMLAPEFTHGTQVRTYRLGIATTAQFTTIFRQAGDTDAQAQTRAFNAVVVSVNRIAGVYQRDFAVSFTLVSNTNLIYATSPEAPADYANTGSADLNANQTNMDSILGSANYDIGHVFGSSDNGVAQLSAVCGSGKARGYSGQPAPQGDGFDVDYVAHEMGHQYGANHTFTATADCNAAPAASQKEPGSAVTIMGYAGICGGNSNQARHSIDTFHVHSLTEMITFVTSGGGASCGTLAGANIAPVITPLTNFTIPVNTPFVLTASATDANSNPLTYSWEQNDAATSPSNYPATTDDDDISLVFRPGFRSYSPLATGTRTFPSMTYVLNNANEAPIFFGGVSPVGADCADSPGGQCITAEDLPSAARTMNFRVTVRDGQGGVTDAGTVLTVVNTGTFKVVDPNGPTLWNAGSLKTITWDPAGSTGSGMNVATVKISLSTNGGTSFDTVLFAATPNDGSESIVAPAINTSQARIKVEAIGNIFFDVSDANFSISATPATNGFLAGRVTTVGGRGVGNVRITITTGSTTYFAMTSSFGYFLFEALPYGNITVTPGPKKGLTFTPPSIAMNHNSDNFAVNFVGQ